MSTLDPRPAYSDAELATLYPPHLRLQLVQILLRHGERTPVSARFTNAGLPPFWPYCGAARHLRSAVLDPGPGPGSPPPFSTLEWKRRLETFGPGDAPIVAAGPAAELDGICDMGMLTDRGRETTLQLGQRLRRLYVDQLGFLPAGLGDTDFFYLRATPIPRALESMQQALQGLYPSHTRAPDLAPPTILSRTPADETLFPNDGNCRRFAALSRAFAQRAADRWNGSEDMAFLTKKLGRWMPDDSPRVAVDSRPRLSGIMDTINATNAHGPQTKLPADFYNAKVKHIVEKIGVEEWYAGYKESQEYRTLGIGALLADVVSRMVGSAEQTAGDGGYPVARRPCRSGAGPLRFGLSGCHDTTLAATLASLGAFDTDAWPPFTSHVAVELFRHADKPPSPSRASSSWPSLLGGLRAGAPPPGIGRKPVGDLTDAERRRLDGYYVRIRYNDKPVAVPGCKPPGKHLDGDETFCTLASPPLLADAPCQALGPPFSPADELQEAFKAIVDKFTPRDWKQQCRANVGAPAFPATPEPAGY